MEPWTVSYSLCMGADILKPSSILSMTRNAGNAENIHLGYPLSPSKRIPVTDGAKMYQSDFRLHGVDEIPLHAHVMSGLIANQGQMLLAAGIARQTNTADLAEQIGAHRNSLGGIIKGTPVDEVILPGPVKY